MQLTQRHTNRDTGHRPHILLTSPVGDACPEMETWLACYTVKSKTHPHVHTHAHTYTHTCARTHTHTHTHTHIHTHITHRSLSPVITERQWLCCSFQHCAVANAAHSETHTDRNNGHHPRPHILLTCPVGVVRPEMETCLACYTVKNKAVKHTRTRVPTNTHTHTHTHTQAQAHTHPHTDTEEIHFSSFLYPWEIVSLSA